MKQYLTAEMLFLMRESFTMKDLSISRKNKKNIKTLAISLESMILTRTKMLQENKSEGIGLLTDTIEEMTIKINRACSEYFKEVEARIEARIISEIKEQA